MFKTNYGSKSKIIAVVTRAFASFLSYSSSNHQLCLGLGLNLVLFASSTNVESGTRFDEVCFIEFYIKGI